MHTRLLCLALVVCSSWTTGYCQDTTPPTGTLSFSRAPSYLTSGPVTVTADYDEELSSAITPTLTFSGAAASASNFDVTAPEAQRASATEYVYTVSVQGTTPQTGNAYVVTLAGGRDLAGNAQADVQTSGVVDLTAPGTPTLSFSRGPAYLTSGPLTVTADYDENLPFHITPTLTFSGAAATAGNFSTTTPQPNRIEPARFTYHLSVHGTTPATGNPYIATLAGAQDFAGNVQVDQQRSGIIDLTRSIGSVRIGSPLSSQLSTIGETMPFFCEVLDRAGEPLDDVTPTWSSSASGVLTIGQCVVGAFAKVGLQQLTVAVVAANGTTGTSSEDILVLSDDWAHLHFSHPSASGIVIVTSGLNLEVTANSSVPESVLATGVWRAEPGGVLGCGRTLFVPRDQLTPGPSQLSFTLCDSDTQSCVTTSLDVVLATTAPVLTVLTPVESAQFAPEQVVSCHAQCWFPGDVDPADVRIEWCSNLDGTLATGHTTQSSLSTGDHVLTVTAIAQRWQLSQTVHISVLSENQMLVSSAAPSSATPPPLRVLIESPVEPAWDTVGQSIDFSAFPMFGSAGAMTIASWTWSTAAQTVFSTAPAGVLTATTTGLLECAVTATTTGGIAATTSCRVMIIDAAPVLVIASPIQESFFTTATTVPLIGAVSGSLPSTMAASLMWSIDGVGTVGVGQQLTTGPLAVGDYTLTASLTSASGLAATSSVRFHVTETSATLRVLRPYKGQEFFEDAPIICSAYSSIPGYGAILPQDLTWTSDAGTLIGTGSTASTTAMNPGLHVVVVQGTCETVSLTAAVNVLVQPTPPSAEILEPTTPEVCTLPNEPALRAVVSTGHTSATSAVWFWESHLDGPLGEGLAITPSLSPGVHRLTFYNVVPGLGVAQDSSTVTIASSTPLAAIGSVTGSLRHMSGTTLTLISVTSFPSQGPATDGGVVWDVSEPIETTTGTLIDFVPHGVGPRRVSCVAHSVAGMTAATHVSVTALPPYLYGFIEYPEPCATVPGDQPTFLSGGLSIPPGQIDEPASVTWTSSVDGVLSTSSTTMAVLSTGLHTIVLSQTARTGETTLASLLVEVIDPLRAMAITAAIERPYSAGEPLSLDVARLTSLPLLLDERGLVWRSSLDGNLGGGFTLSTTGLSVGTHTLTVEGWTSAGGRRVSTSITVEIDAPTPTLTLVSPVNGLRTFHGQPLLLLATATAPWYDGPFFYQWHSGEQEDLSTQPAAIVTGLAQGPHDIAVSATTRYGTTTGAAASILVTIAPQVLFGTRLLDTTATAPLLVSTAAIFPSSGGLCSDAGVRFVVQNPGGMPFDANLHMVSSSGNTPTSVTVGLSTTNTASLASVVSTAEAALHSVVRAIPPTWSCATIDYRSWQCSQEATQPTSLEFSVQTPAGLPLGSVHRFIVTTH